MASSSRPRVQCCFGIFELLPGDGPPVHQSFSPIEVHPELSRTGLRLLHLGLKKRDGRVQGAELIPDIRIIPNDQDFVRFHPAPRLTLISLIRADLRFDGNTPQGFDKTGRNAADGFADLLYLHVPYGHGDRLES